MMDSYGSGRINQNKLFHKSLLVMEFYHGNKKVTNVLDRKDWLCLFLLQLIGLSPIFQCGLLLLPLSLPLFPSPHAWAMVGRLHLKDNLHLDPDLCSLYGCKLLLLLLRPSCLWCYVVTAQWMPPKPRVLVPL